MFDRVFKVIFFINKNKFAKKAITKSYIIIFTLFIF